MIKSFIRNWKTFAWAVACLGLTIHFALQAVDDQNFDRMFKAKSVTATGIVIDSFGGVAGRQDDEGEPPYVEYRFIADDGNEYKGSTEGVYETIGEQVSVNYLPSNPEVNRVAGVDGSRSNLGLAVMSGIAALMFVGFAIKELRATQALSDNKNRNDQPAALTKL